ncbi:cytidine deaminase-like protein [Hygrophoropsis aurantiaca]|uniref:Cytidine deaminase-like protein n=1 Tax=Hygrophoropsis aurantiaca TaxID=72124 RepID=A0ACB8AHB5_9AGAM|nr:cytidine deaminase-like protein [Hygrophoropsis aurantiaca]
MSILSAEDRNRLIVAATEAKEFSYSPYSRFRVGAALLSTDGKIIKGANIENASYGGAICAERTAIVKAASEGIRSFVGLAVTSDVASSIAPCGICRQVLREFCALDMPVLLVPADYPQPGAEGDGGILDTTLEGLLPHSFGPEHLELPRQS